MARVETVRAKEVLVSSKCGTEAVTKVKAKRQFLKSQDRSQTKGSPQGKLCFRTSFSSSQEKGTTIHWQLDSLLMNGQNLETQMQDKAT